LAVPLPSRNQILTVCLDANVIISAMAFGGTPLEVLNRVLDGDCLHVTSKSILQEVRRNLVGKLEQDEQIVDEYLSLLSQISSIYSPSGHIKATNHPPDNLVLELAVIASCDVLVTGDKKHLLPLNPFRGVLIESPAHFLKRLKLQT